MNNKKQIKVLKHKNYLAELEKEDATLVCSDISNFEDDCEGKCDECGKKIVFRSYNKKAKKKICIDCASKGIAG